MKKLFLILSVCIYVQDLNAQELTFEQTVKYIKEKLIEFDDDGRYKDDGEFKATKNGDLRFDWMSKFKVNLFNLNDNKRPENIVHGWIEVAHPAVDDNMNFPCIFFYSDGKGIAALYFKSNVTVSDLERLCKALIHLRTLCTKEKDPFDDK